MAAGGLKVVGKGIGFIRREFVHLFPAFCEFRAGERGTGHRNGGLVHGKQVKLELAGWQSEAQTFRRGETACDSSTGLHWSGKRLN